MAIWQITFYIIDDNLSEIDINMEFDDGLFWKKSNKKKSFFDTIEYFLKKEESWSSKIIQYGKLESNCLEVYYDDFEKIQSVSFRIDFMTDYEVILDKIILFCINNNLRIVTPEGKIMTLQLDYFKLYILQFIKDHGFEYNNI